MNDEEIAELAAAMAELGYIDVDSVSGEEAWQEVARLFVATLSGLGYSVKRPLSYDVERP